VGEGRRRARSGEQGQILSGPEHCDWQDITVLSLGPEGDAEQYLRHAHGELAQFLQTTYDATAALPRTAIDTRLHRAGGSCG
jgi:hypothetical protein